MYKVSKIAQYNSIMLIFLTQRNCQDYSPSTLKILQRISIQYEHELQGARDNFISQ